MGKIKLNYNPNLTDEQNKELEKDVFKNPRSAGTGVGLTEKLEYIPEFIAADAESVISNANSYIVLGRDRPGSRMGGYGGLGAIGAHSIDLVVGRRAIGGSPGARTFVDPSFTTDAARIYISEKTDVDINFKIVDGSNGSAINTSAIGLKADAIRIIGDEGGIKLLTRVNSRNTNNKIIPKVSGIELIAGNDDSDLQSMVKGENLRGCLKDIISQINDINGVVTSLVASMNLFEAAMLAHVHPPGAPSPVIPGPYILKLQSNISQMSKTITQKLNLASTQFNFLSSLGTNYILSEHNKVN
jgi:hypothetical protein